MNTFTKITLTLSAVAALSPMLPAKAETMVVDGFRFDTNRDLFNITSEVYSDAVTLTGYEGFETSLEIPATFSYNGKSYTVREIYPKAFMGLRFIESVKIPDYVSYIGAEAFAETGLKEISLGHSVYRIGNEAFRNVPVESVRIYRALPPEDPYLNWEDMTNTTRIKRIFTIFRHYEDGARYPEEPRPLSDNPSPDELEWHEKEVARYEQECRDWEQFHENVKEASVTHATLYVPESAIDTYKNLGNSVWGTFQDYAVLDDYVEAGIHDLESNGNPDAKVTVYDITGRSVLRNITPDLVNSLPSGIYIVNGRKIMK